MKTKLFILAVLPVFFASAAFAQGLADVEYPVQELGGCKDVADCKAYCDKPANADSCLAFAERNNLMTKKEVQTAEKFLSGDLEGPGGCSSKDSCQEYCNDMSHIDECVAFAEKNNFLSQDELKEIKSIQSAIKKGVKMPNCKNKKECDSYCESTDHMEECIEFGAEAGFIQGKELEDAQKMLQAIKKGVKPLPCNGKEACDEYCSKSENMEACMTFAMEAGFMTEEEKSGAQGMMQALKKGVKPPACKGKEECDVYCNSDEHMQECIDFSVAAGMMSAEDAEMAKKTGGKGPGGCKGKEECNAFCNDPANQQTCFEFGRDNGLISEEELKQMEEGNKKFYESLNNAPAEVKECLVSVFGDLSKVFPSKETGDKMGECYNKFMGPAPQQGLAEPGQAGPGGCKGEEECQKYCQANPEECKNFKSGPGGEPGQQQPEMPKQTGPGGCQSPEECEKYCQANPQACGAPAPQEGSMPQSQQMAPGPMPQDQPGQLQAPQKQPPQEQQQIQQTQPSSEPGSGGQMAPGEAVPQMEVAPQQQPQDIQPPPGPEPSAFLKPESFLGAVLYIVAKALYSLR